MLQQKQTYIKKLNMYKKTKENKKEKKSAWINDGENIIAWWKEF